MRPSPRPRAAGLLLAGPLLAGLLAGCAGTAPAAAPPVAVAWHGTEPQSPTERPSFVLRDTSGAPYDFRERTAGRPTLLYFGYTNCPDECPTAMADISSALRQAPADVREEVQVVFVTTDPARDTPVVLERWLEPYAPGAVGLVGSQAEVDAAQQAVGAPVAEKQGPLPTLPGRPDQHEHAAGTAPHSHAGPLGYGVGHADAIFAYDVADRLPVVYPGGTLPADLAADLPALAGRPVTPTPSTGAMEES